MLRHALKLFLLLASAMGANATMMTFKLELLGTGSGSPGSGTVAVSNDRPHVRLTNTSDAGVQITRFILSIGDTAKNYDHAIALEIGGGTFTSYSLVTSGGDRADLGGNSLRGNFIEYTFGGFDRNEFFRFSADIDNDTGVFDTPANDYRTVLFNNGAAVPNAIATVYFLYQGQTTIRQLELMDSTAGLSSYTFVSTVPEPGTMSMIALGALAIIASRIRRAK